MLDGSPARRHARPMRSIATPDGSNHPMATRPIPVTAFIDWNTQMHNARVGGADPHTKAERTLQKTAQTIGRSLARYASDTFHVVLRLYHGWHKGWEPTESLRAMVSAVSATDFSVLARTPNVVWSSNVQYGHTLLSALPERTHVRPPIHLPNTLRRGRARNQRAAEKMVDTALAADLLDWARRGENEWALVLSEDDDVVPPLFTAEAWIQPHGGRVFLLRASRPTGYLKLDGLLMDGR